MSQQPASERGVTYLTPEAYERLTSELNELKTEGRERVSQAIGTAREHGDIRENADYDAAKNEQGMMEARIRQLETLLSSAVVGEVAGTSGVAGPGTVVVVEIAGDEETYFLGSREEAIDGMDVLSVQSALGQAVSGRKVGDKFSYVTPTGRELPVKLLQAEPRS
jgi:transcription elongation factor GreA